MLGGAIGERDRNVRSRIKPGIDRREIPEDPDEDQCGESASSPRKDGANESRMRLTRITEATHPLTSDSTAESAVADVSCITETIRSSARALNAVGRACCVQRSGRQSFRT
jgi:hypothetical protein